ncbi:aldehyde dehydrogenase family protein [Sphingomonas sp.]|uniref:aldehyde dehydrogenase family protein n=1 Tax=Sphingomonas sp. TaxID=28214 RepID=UPI001E05CEA7|nr:aldehyde dehydrogenase family protein [Sphingomonas sp.]MBX9796042.1 aldehyde dehydrogenase family protein [Sphingomonas sp.]
MFECINPATGAIAHRLPEMTPDQVEAAVARAHAAQIAWRQTGLAERSRLLEAIADAFEADADRLAALATTEMGKTFASARAEVMKCAGGFRYYAKAGPAMLADVAVPMAAGTVYQRWLPMGVVLAVMPWNFPYWQVVRFLAPTIMAGNAGLLKHASLTQGCAAAIEERVRAAGAPDGLFQNLAIRAGGVAPLIADDRVAAVTLTGSEEAGAKVAAAAGAALKKVVLELGGSDPFIVMPSADLDAAVAAAVTGRLQNAGQSCICAKRIIVHADIYDAFAERYTAAMLAAKVGDPMDPANVIGPLSSAEQRDTVLDQLARFQAAGARLAGGTVVDGPGAYLTPGVLTGVPADHPIAQEELFGPVAMLFRVDSAAAAVALANDVPFGLGSSVWTRDAAEKDYFVDWLECGMTAINQVLASMNEAAFGGVKKSGHGRELGPWGMHEFMNLKTVMMA